MKADIIHFGIMSANDYWPDWLKKQMGLRYSAIQRGTKKRYLNKREIVRRYAKEMRQLGKRVTHEAVREVLQYVDREYTTDRRSISSLLHYSGDTKYQDKYSNGHRVAVVGEERIYRSINDAASDKKCSPEFIRKWAASGTANRRGEIWHYVDANERSR